MIPTTSFKDVYLVGVGYTALVVLLIAFVADETMCESPRPPLAVCTRLTGTRTDDRDVVPFPERPTTGLRYRIETLIGITGVKMAKCVPFPDHFSCQC